MQAFTLTAIPDTGKNFDIKINKVKVSGSRCVLEGYVKDSY